MCFLLIIQTFNEDLCNCIFINYWILPTRRNCFIKINHPNKNFLFIVIIPTTFHPLFVICSKIFIQKFCISHTNIPFLFFDTILILCHTIFYLYYFEIYTEKFVLSIKKITQNLSDFCLNIFYSNFLGLQFVEFLKQIHSHNSFGDKCYFPLKAQHYVCNHFVFWIDKFCVFVGANSQCCSKQVKFKFFCLFCSFF